MMKKLLFFVLSLTLAFTLAACGGQSAYPVSSEPLEQSSQNTPAEDAYLEVFKNIYTPQRLAGYTNYGIYYISLNLDGVLHEHPERVKAKLEEYLKGTGVILLWENMESLIEQGYVLTYNGSATSFAVNGELFRFFDSALTDVLLETKVTWWSGDLAGSWQEYKIQMRGGMWEITRIKLGLPS